MKKIKLLTVIFACIFMQSMSAKDVYLSATGNDANDGLTAATAVKSLLRASEVIAMEDVVHVSGVIKITDEPGFETKINDGTLEPDDPEFGIYLYHRGYFIRQALNLGGVTFLGSDPVEDGFSGDKRAPLFQLQGANPLTFKNLQFVDARTHKAPTGQYGSDASVMWARGDNVEVTFENCIFSGNDIARDPNNPTDPGGMGDRGVFTAMGGTYKFIKCEFTDNAGKEGGCLFVGGGSYLIEDCYFGYNNCAEINGSKGGAIYTWVNGVDGGPMELTIKNCVFEGNTASAGGAITFLDKVNYEATVSDIIIDHCAFVGNEAVTQQGGAIYLDSYPARRSVDNITISNSLFYGNRANSEGGAICIWNVKPNSQLYMINTTLYGNVTYGSAAQGGGLGFMKGYESDGQTFFPENMEKHIYNCIFDGNTSEGGEGGREYSDLAALAPPEEEGWNDVFEILNSYVGRAVNMLGRQGCDPDQNFIDYCFENEYIDAVGFDYPDYYGPHFHWDENTVASYGIPLLEDSPARTYGDPQYLVGTTDLSGKPWVIDDGKCAIGCSEVTSEELDEGGWSPSYIIGLEQDKPVRLVVVNGRLHCINPLPETAFITLYSLMGSKIAGGENSLSIPDTATGVYVATVKIGQNLYKQKLIIK